MATGRDWRRIELMVVGGSGNDRLWQRRGTSRCKKQVLGDSAVPRDEDRMIRRMLLRIDIGRMRMEDRDWYGPDLYKEGKTKYNNQMSVWSRGIEKGDVSDIITVL